MTRRRPPCGAIICGAIAAAWASLAFPQPQNAFAMDLFRPAIAVTPEGLTCVLGGGLDGRLVDSRRITPLMTHKQEYALVTLEGVSDIAWTIGRPRENVGGEGDCEGTFQQEMTLGPGQLGDYIVAVLGSKQEAGSFLPQKVETLPNIDTAAETALREYLGEMGLPDARTAIRQLIRTDLDGDGKEETLINALNTGRETMRRGEYSVVLLLRESGGEMQTVEIASEITTEDSDEVSVLWENTIAGIVDLDGDGEMEIVLYGAFYLGDGWQVIHLRDGQISDTLACGCGG